jgi:hypothetical protein
MITSLRDRSEAESLLSMRNGKESTPSFGPLLHLRSTRARLNLLPQTRPSATVDTILALSDHALELHSFDHAEEPITTAVKVFCVTDSTCISLG